MSDDLSIAAEEPDPPLPFPGPATDLPLLPVRIAEAASQESERRKAGGQGTGVLFDLMETAISMSSLGKACSVSSNCSIIFAPHRWSVRQFFYHPPRESQWLSSPRPLLCKYHPGLWSICVRRSL